MKKVLFLSLLLIVAAPFIYASCSTLDITDEVVGPFTVGHAANFQIHACCGTAPYTFTIYSGTLPSGLSLSSSGLITGTPAVGSDGDTVVCFTVTDAAGCHLTKCFQITVFP